MLEALFVGCSDGFNDGKRSCGISYVLGRLRLAHRASAAPGAAPFPPPRACPESQGSVRARGGTLSGYRRVARRVAGLHARRGVFARTGAIFLVAALGVPLPGGTGAPLLGHPEPRRTLDH